MARQSQSERRREQRDRIERALVDLKRHGDAHAVPERHRRRLLGQRKLKHEPSPGFRAMAERVGVDGRALNQVADEQAMASAAALFRAMGSKGPRDGSIVLDFEGAATAMRGPWAIAWMYGAHWKQLSEDDCVCPREMYLVPECPVHGLLLPT